MSADSENSSWWTAVTEAEAPAMGCLDRQFGELMATLESDVTGEGATIYWIAALASRFSRDGHLCYHYAQAETFWNDNRLESTLVPFSRWERLAADCFVVGRPGEFKPLIQDDQGRIYLHRYWSYQQTIAQFFQRQALTRFPVNQAALAEGLSRLFAERFTQTASGNMRPDLWDGRVLAAFAAVRRGFTLISGGPGTGKTTTVAGILALLQAQAPEPDLRIALAAPTGKAAARLEESVAGVKRQLTFSDRILAAVPEEAQTLHRLLGSLADSLYFRYNAENKLPVDVVVVDEASMVDVALLAKLVAALPEPCRLILVGDKDQLASVEAGSVLADIGAAGGLDRFSPAFRSDLAGLISRDQENGAVPDRAQRPWLDDVLVQLNQNYRFGEDSGINRLSGAVRRGASDEASDILAAERYPDVAWRRGQRETSWLQDMLADLQHWFRDYLSVADDLREMFQRFEQLRILCALREGPHGANRLNRVISEALGGGSPETLADISGKWYAGRPVIIVQNDYQQRLFNGDVGLTRVDEDGQLFVYFPEGTDFRRFPPWRLPAHETAFALTVHKSQGTEFDRVICVLPAKDSPVLTRELIYTAITRAKQQIEFFGSPVVLTKAIGRRTFRMSGLTEALQADDPETRHF